MLSTLTRNWMLLVLRGVLDAIIAIIYFVMWSTGGPITFHSWNGTVVLLGELALASVGSGIIVLAFLALGLRWIEIQPGSHLDLLWLGSYFAFNAACMLSLPLRLHGHPLPS